MEAEKERNTFLVKLALLDKMMKLHEFSVFGQQEAEDLEVAETKMDSEASGSMTEPPEEE